MNKTVIKPKRSPRAIGPYSQAVKTDAWIFTAGQIPLDPKTNEIIPGDISAQTRQVLTNLKNLLAEAESSLEKVVKCTVFLKNLNDFSAMNAVYAEFFPADTAPARSTIEVARLPKDALIEIEAVAIA